METSDLAKRMKRYEAVSKTTLVTRMPVILRIDGKAFHTLTRGFQKPFDRVLNLSMMETMRFLCKNIQGCVLGYTQSDEITLVLVDYKKLTSNPWFDYEVQKMCSVGASMATVGFNNAFARRVEEFSIHGGGMSLVPPFANGIIWSIVNKSKRTNFPHSAHFPFVFSYTLFRISIENTFLSTIISTSSFSSP